MQHTAGTAAAAAPPGHGADDVGELRKRVEALEARHRRARIKRESLSRWRRSCRRSPPSKPRQPAPASSNSALHREIARRMGRLADGVLAYRRHHVPSRPRESAGRLARGQHAPARLRRHRIARRASAGRGPCWSCPR